MAAFNAMRIGTLYAKVSFAGPRIQDGNLVVEAERVELYVVRDGEKTPTLIGTVSDLGQPRQ